MQYALRIEGKLVLLQVNNMIQDENNHSQPAQGT